MEAAKALAFALDRLQDRGRFFIEPGDQVYKGQVIGEHTRDKDLIKCYQREKTHKYASCRFRQ